MSLRDLESHARSVFRARFGGEATVIARAPGRVELLGNHTDYNGGLVMSAAVDRYTVVAGRPGEDARARVYAEPFDEIDVVTRFDAPPNPERRGRWTQYVRGVLLQCRDTAARRGLDAVLVGDIPLGTGLSSSASLESAVALFADALGPAAQGWDDAARLRLARTLRDVENRYVGVACGLLDQFSVLLGQADHALWLDCASEDFGRVPLGDPAPALVICDSKTSRRLADGPYNRRRAECESVLGYFQELNGGRRVRWLRDLSPGDLEAHWAALDPVGRRRARHVLTENERVRRGIAALTAGDLADFGRLMSASHDSSRDDFENSSAALDALIEAARESTGFLGGKLSGAGWAGCTVNLVAADKASAFAESVRAGYTRRTGTVPDVHICRAADGASASPASP
jgi:galactokinase